MGIGTILRFLLGSRQAILDIAASRQAIWLGLLFVLSAGFAREYDGEDLLHEPWHLLLPLVASLITATILYGVLWVVFCGWATFPNEWRTYRSFLSLYWLTAPLAWIYAIPVERYYSPTEATATNFWFLGIVAAWRVILIIRVAALLFRAPVIQTLYPVLLFADTVLLTLMKFMPRPIVELMGGVHLTQSESMIAGVTFFTAAIGILCWPLLAFGTLLAFFSYSRREQLPSLSQLPAKSVHASAWALAITSLLVWVFVVPFTQPKQQRRGHVDRLMRQQKYVEAFEFMSRFEQRDFPPHWDPPPRIAYRERPGSHLLDVLEGLEQMKTPAAAWVTKEYYRKFDAHLEDYYAFWNEMSDADFERVMKWIEKIPPSEFTLLRISNLRVAVTSEHILSNRTPEQRKRLQQVLQIEDPPPPISDADSAPTQPKPDEAPQTPPTVESTDAGNAADTHADKAADR